MSWTPERTAELIRLHTQGLSAAQIAEQLGGVTRNAVIGKINRLGLSEKLPEPRKHRREPALLGASGCCWPLGHPGEPGFRFCGGQIVPGRPYCVEHCAVAYRSKEQAAAEQAGVAEKKKLSRFDLQRMNGSTTA